MEVTQKTNEALREARKIAQEYSNNAIEQEHMLAAMARQQDGIVPQLLIALGIQPNAFEQAALRKVEDLPRISGSGYDLDSIQPAMGLRAAWDEAEKQAQKRGDQYLSIDCVFLGIL